ncbi:MAG: endolytic transglycosylase MltG [Bdellovibrionales bacterium]|nr:endolytic transglycosylase MltG [Bdellovibrionales bacterium]
MAIVRTLAHFFIGIVLIGALGLGATYWGYSELKAWGTRPKEFSTPVAFQLERGTSLKSFAKALHSNGVVENKLFYEWWVRLFSHYEEYQAGPYQVAGLMTPSDIDRMIRSGETFEPIVLEITIPEGFTLGQILARAEAAGIGTGDQLEATVADKEIREQFPLIPKEATSLEGYLFPATYQFTKIPTAKEFITLLLKTFFERLPNDYVGKLSVLGYSLQDGVIIASLIERETQLDSERSIVSEVIQNRLKKGVALAIDASIIYGIPDFDGNLRRRHLEDLNNLYNSRKHKGLPPGPICSPGEASLQAVVTPTNLDYWYYVVDAENFSKHRFARTLAEHNRNVAAFWKAKKLAERQKKE